MVGSGRRRRRRREIDKYVRRNGESSLTVKRDEGWGVVDDEGWGVGDDEGELLTVLLDDEILDIIDRLMFVECS